MSTSLMSRVRVVVPLLIVAGTFAVIAHDFAAPLLNNDTYFHLRFGQEFATGRWSLTHPGAVSTFGTRHWLPTQWLSEIVMYGAYRLAGYPAVAWLAGAVVLGYAYVLYRACRRYADPAAAAVTMVVAVIASSAGLSARPQVVSYLLIAVTTVVWLESARDLRSRWWLIPLTWVWAMLHGMWTVGPVIGGVAALGIWADSRCTWKRFLALAAVPVGSLVAGGLTPVGPGLYSAVLEVGSRAWYFSEWQATSFRMPQAVAAALLVAVALVVYARKGCAPWVDLFLLVLAAGWVAYSIRSIPTGAAIAAPLTARALQLLLGERRPALRKEHWVIVGAAIVAALGLAIAVPFTSTRLPTSPGLDRALSRIPAGTTIYDQDLYGSVLMWTHPDLNLVIDGYVDPYPTRWLHEVTDAGNVEPGWQTFVKRTGARYALLTEGTPLEYALVQDGWLEVKVLARTALLKAPPGWQG